MRTEASSSRGDGREGHQPRRVGRARTGSVRNGDRHYRWREANVVLTTGPELRESMAKSVAKSATRGVAKGVAKGAAKGAAKGVAKGAAKGVGSGTGAAFWL